MVEEIIMKTKNKLLITLTVFLILFVLIGSASAADDNTTTLSQDTDKEINQDEISTGNLDSSLIFKSNDENTTLKESTVENRTFDDIQKVIDDAKKGDTIELMGEYNGSGDDITIDEDDLTIIGKEGAILDAQDQSRILTIDAKGVILKDITFKTGSGGYEDGAGAVYIKGKGNVTFINCLFDHNWALKGGALFIEGDAAVSFTNCSFIENTAVGRGGGAVYVDDKAAASFTKCSFIGNIAGEWDGGAVYIRNNAEASFTNCSFDKNRASHVDGGAVDVENESTVSFTNCSFTDNYNQYGGVVSMYVESTGSFINCSFFNNNCKVDGGVIYAWYSKYNFTNCSFTNNTSERGLIRALYSRGSLTNCLFNKNSELSMIHAQYGTLNLTNCSFTNNSVANIAYFSLTEEYNLINCSFINNSGGAGAAVFMDGENAGMANFINCSFDNNHGNNKDGKNEGGAVCICNTGASFTNCLFDNNSIVHDGGGAVYIHETYSTYFLNCSFTNNKGPKGGAVFVEKDGANFTDCLFYNNTVNQQGGAVFIGGSVESSFNNCSFTNNNASVGGAIYNKNDKTLIKDSKFIENNATVGQAIKTEKDMSISDSEFRNGKYCIDVESGAKVTLDNVLSDDPPLINEIFIKILEAKDVVYGNNVSIKVQVNSSATTLLNIGKVVVKINNVEYKSDVKNGIATLVIPKLNAGTYNVNVRYDDNNEPKAEIPVNFTVNKASAEIVIANDTLNVQVSDLISAGATLNPAEAGNLTYASSDSNVAIVENNTIKALSIGTAVITVSSTGNNNYDVADEKNITVNVGARIWYVDDDADHDGDGRSKETAFRTFQDALDVAGHDDIIMIAEGSYSYGRNVDLTINTENLTIMKYGDGEAIFDAHEECTIWDCGVNVNIIGLTFKGARSQTISDSQGGALNLVGTDNDNVHVKDCKFINNAASYGGAMFIYSGTVTNCTFIGNNADSNGGAVFMQYGTITTCTFINNTSPHGGAICCGMMEGIVADTCIFKSHSDGTVRVSKHSPTMNGDMFTKVYNSSEKLTFDLKTNSGIPVDDGIISIKLYNKTNGASIANYSCLSGEGWTVDLPVGSYYAILNTEYANFKPVNRTINVLPDIEYYVNVIPTTSNNLTVDIFAKSNIPQDIVEGKLQFILPNGTQIDAILIQDDEWWAQYTFDDYGDYGVSASYIGLNNVTINNDTIIISTKPMSTINITDVVLNYGEIKNVTVNTTGAAGITAKINNVDAKVDGFTIEIPVMDAGDYTLRVTTIPYNDYCSVTELVTITVNKAPTEIVIANDTLNVSMVDLISTGASLTPADAGNLNYTSSNSSVVIVENGKIKPVGVGTAVITVSFAGNDNYMAAKDKTITVNVSLCDASVSVNNSTLDLFVDNTFTLVAVTTPEGLNVTYVPDDSGVVSVADDGVVTALKEGTAKITVKVGGDGVYAENSTVVTVNVKNKIATEINITSSTGEMSVGAMGHVAAELIPSEAGNLTYVSNDTSVVNVSSTGVIKANKVGTALITVSFAGNDKYAPAENKTITITVNLKDASVSVENSTVNLKFNDTFDIVATTSPVGLVVSYTSSNEAVVTVDNKGRITTVGTGRAVVTVSVGGDGVYALNSTTIDVIVKKELNLNATVFTLGNMTLIVTGFENATGNVSITVGGNNYTSSIIGGVVFVSLPKFDENVTAYVYYPGDENYCAASTTADIIAKHDLNITVAADPIYVGEDAVVVVSGLENATGNVLIIAGKSFFNSTIINGIATASIPGLNNTTTVIVLYLGDDNYNIDFAIANITVSPKENLTIGASAKAIYVGDKATVVVTGLENATGNVTVRVNNKTYSGIIVDGTAKVVISGLTKSVTAYVDYDGDRRYNPSNTTVKVTVNKIKTTLTAKSVTAVYNVYKNLVITLKDSKGNPISGVKLSVNLGKTRTVTTNKKGQAKVSTKGLVPKKYTAKITFKGNTKYLKSTKSVKVTVKKATPKLYTKTKTFKKSVKIKKLTVTLKTNKNKVMKNVRLTIKVNKKTYSAKTNSKGKAIFKITKLTKKGKYTAFIKYKANKYYNAKTVKVKITVK